MTETPFRPAGAALDRVGDRAARARTMGQRADDATRARDLAIVAAVDAGWSYRPVAAAAQLSVGMVAKIVAREAGRAR